jgi:hypothetical protein
MKLNAIGLQRAILFGSITSLLLVSPNVLATSEDTATLDVKATLSPAITIECNTALNFGKLIVPTGSRNGSTEITMDPSSGFTQGGSQGEVTFGGGSSPGQCELTSGPDGVDHTIKLFNTNSNTELGRDGTGTGFGLGSSAGDAATTPASINVIPKLTTTTISFTDGGANTFNIGGVITIPDDLVSDNYGDYQKTIDVKVTESL